MRKMYTARAQAFCKKPKRLKIKKKTIKLKYYFCNDEFIKILYKPVIIFFVAKFSFKTSNLVINNPSLKVLLSSMFSFCCTSITSLLHR